MLSTVLVCASRVDEPGFAFNEYWNPLALVIPMTENLPLNPELLNTKGIEVKPN